MLIASLWKRLVKKRNLKNSLVCFINRAFPVGSFSKWVSDNGERLIKRLVDQMILSCLSGHSLMIQMKCLARRIAAAIFL